MTEIFSLDERLEAVELKTYLCKLFGTIALLL